MIFSGLFLGSFISWSAVALCSTVESQNVRVIHGQYQTPLVDMSTLSETEYTKLGHPAFPRHRVRVKKSNFCDGTVNSYTGYIDIEARHLYFYFFESRADPDKDDVIFWVNGGPGGSSAMGLFMEMGPCRVVNSTHTEYHPYSWNSNANIFFVDQPVGVGYSYADYGETVTTTEEAAKDIAAFIAIFFENFSKFKGRPLHMASESYGGRYIPVFASEVFDQNQKLAQAGLSPVNLTSIMIGNGDTDIFTMGLSYYDKSCTAASGSPILDIRTCIKMKQVLPRCKKWMTESCIDQFDAISCSAAVSFCEEQLIGPFSATGISPYDITRKCEGAPEKTACYFLTEDVEKYINLPETRQAMGIDSTAPKFNIMSMKVNSDFANTLDGLHPTYDYVAALLDRGVRVLIYVGRNDWICNDLGNEAWTTQFDWSGHDEFASQPLREWKIDGRKAGFARSAKGLTYVSVDGAGHMVPFDKPKESLVLVTRWLNNNEL